MSSHDPNAELNPNMIIGAAFFLIIAAFGVVAGIILGSEAKTAGSAAMEKK